MNPVLNILEERAARVPFPIAFTLPNGDTVGSEGPRVHIRIRSNLALPALADGRIGNLGMAIVEGQVEVEGSMRDVMAAAAAILDQDPVAPESGRWSQAMAKMRSMALHTLSKDAQQIRFHYDLSDDFYALWLDPLRVYSCGYYAAPEMTLDQAQEAKLDHICRKLRLQPGERLLDIGAGWGGLIIWAAQHYGVKACGITLSENQLTYVQQKIAQLGLQGQVEMRLCDYRELPSSEPFDKIGSVGMFEHVGRINMPAYFSTVKRLLKPGGLALIHGITAGGVDNVELGAGLGEFIERYIFPGGELMHVSAVLHDLAQSGLEMLDTENLRPHYARTLWAWSDALEAQLPQARAVLQHNRSPEEADKVLRAYRLYLAGCAMGFERGWLALHQMLASHPSGNLHQGAIVGAQSSYPFNRSYIYPSKG